MSKKQWVFPKFPLKTYLLNGGELKVSKTSKRKQEKMIMITEMRKSSKNSCAAGSNAVKYHKTAENIPSSLRKKTDSKEGSELK